MLPLDVGRAFYGAFAALHSAQRAAIPPLMAGADVLVRSRTGSGKTEAVLAPLIARYRDDARAAAGPAWLYATPTRALANDLLRRVEAPLERLGLAAGIRHGERNDLARRRKPDLLLTTPESLDVLLTSRSPLLGAVRAVILDELHLLYNSQRGFQTAILLQRLEARTGRPVQVAGLSATIASPAEIWDVFRPGRDVIAVDDPQRKPLDAHITAVAGLADLAALLDRAAGSSGAKVLLFVNTRREADQLAAALHGQTRFGANVFCHHASLDRAARLAVERQFRELPSALCVATSTLELGIDIGDIDLVVLYDRPSGWEAFLQRAGRGSRREDKTNLLGVVAPEHGSLVAGALTFAALLTQVDAGRLEREAPVTLYGAAAQQLLAVLQEHDGAYRATAELAALFRPWPHLDRPAIEALLSSLATGDYVRAHPVQHAYGAGEQAHRLRALGLLWTNFPLRSRDVRLTTYERDLGTIPGNNLLVLHPGDVVRFAGRCWRVRQVGPDEIRVEPTAEPPDAAIIYPEPGAALDPTLLEELLRLLAGHSGAAATVEGDALEAALPWLAASLRPYVIAAVARLRPYVGWDRLPWTADEDSCCYFTFAGQAVNRVIAAWSGQTPQKAGDILLRVPEPIAFERLPADPAALAQLAAMATRQLGDLTAFQLALPPAYLDAELADRWRCTPVYARALARLRSARLVWAPPEELAEWSW